MSGVRGGAGPGSSGAALLLVVIILTSACTQAASGSRAPTSEPSGTSAASRSSATQTAQPRAAEAQIDLRAGIDEAARFAGDQGLTVGIAVIDRSDGEEVANGAAADTPVFTASLVKLFLADNLVHRQRAGEFQLSTADRDLLEAMLIASDDDAADSLYSRFGGDAMVTEVARRYGLPSVAPTNQAGEWELTTVSARDIARYYDRFLVQTPPIDRDYLIDLLRRTTRIAIDGFDQFFGLRSALPGQTLAFKQGWMCCPRETSYLHSTGIVGADNRYTVAIVSDDPGVSEPAYATGVLDRIAALIFPPGSV